MQQACGNPWHRGIWFYLHSDGRCPFTCSRRPRRGSVAGFRNQLSRSRPGSGAGAPGPGADLLASSAKGAESRTQQFLEQPGGLNDRDPRKVESEGAHQHSGRSRRADGSAARVAGGLELGEEDLGGNRLDSNSGGFLQGALFFACVAAALQASGRLGAWAEDENEVALRQHPSELRRRPEPGPEVPGGGVAVSISDASVDLRRTLFRRREPEQDPSSLVFVHPVVKP